MDWRKLLEEAKAGELEFLLIKMKNSVLQSVLEPVQIDEKLPPIFLFSSTRSGSTWVFELLLRAARYRAVFEPLPELDDCLEEYGTPRPVLDRDSHAPKLGGFLTSVMAKNGHRSHAAKAAHVNSRNLRFFTRGVAAKSTRANFCIDFIKKALEPLGTRYLFLVRNPFAVIRSRLVRGSADGGALGSKFSYDPMALFGADLESFQDCFSGYVEFGRGLKTQAEIEAFSWCMENKQLLDLEKAAGWHPIVYENLFVAFDDEFRSVCRHVGIPFRRRVSKHRRTKSTTSFSGSDRRFIRSSSFQDEGRFLRQWKNSFSAEQVRDVCAVLERFQIDYASLLNESARDLTDLPA